MTDPQDDVPCRDCKRPTQHATERCDDCRTLANVVACFDEENPGLYSPALGVYHLPDHGGILTLFADRWVAESDPESDERPWESLSAFVEASDDYRKSRALRAERDTLAAEVKRLREELEKPVAGAWRRELFGSQVRWHASAGEGDRIAAIARPPGGWRGGWTMLGFWGAPESSGPETGDAGRHAADLALLAAGYRLVGGVHPLPDEVRS